MNVVRWLRACGFAALVALTSGGAYAAETTTADAGSWPQKMLSEAIQSFATSKTVPLSLTYDGRPSRQWLADWTVSRQSQEDADRTQSTVTYTDPVSHLEVRAEICCYRDFPAVEWVLHLKNGGDRDTPILEQVRPLDMTWKIRPQEAEVILHRALGCTSTISDFAPLTDILAPGGKSTIAPVGGRSSNGVMPFFNLELPDGHGVMIAVGWTGQWEAEFTRPYRDGGSKVTVQAGMANTHLKLLPGEEIRTPRILLLFWEGTPVEGHNQFRRFLLRHKTPWLEGKPAELPLAGNSFFQFNANGVTEENQIAFARTYKDRGLDLDCYWVDAGWYEGGWPHGVGNWFPNSKAFPHGLRKLSDAVHAMGMKFLLWFEPERVAAGSWLHREHPEWLLSHADGAWVYCPDGSGPRNYLLNLGNPEARAWLTEHVSRMIEEDKIDIFRQDANIDPLSFWPLADAPDRQGITEIRHVEGLYAFWDELRARHPGLLIECCCSGNRRFDLESISRTINLWRSDYCFHPTGDQCQTVGISPWIQLHANGCKEVDPYTFRSMLGPGMCLCWDPRAADFPLEQARQDLALAKRARPYFTGDYYPLTPYSTKEDVWLAYQFHRAELDEGIVLAFRRPACSTSDLLVQLGGVNPSAEYEVENVDSGQTSRYRGAELASSLKVSLQEKPGSAVLFYRRAK